MFEQNHKTVIHYFGGEFTVKQCKETVFEGILSKISVHLLYILR